MLQWNPRLVVLLAAVALVVAALGGYVQSLADGLTW